LVKSKLFYHQIHFKQSVPKNPALIEIQEKVDFGYDKKELTCMKKFIIVGSEN